MSSSAANGPSAASSSAAQKPSSADVSAAAPVAAASPSAVAVQGEEFQRYLEKSGVIDALTKVLVGLYESSEKPTNAIDYVKEYLGVSVSPASVSLQSVVDAQQKLLSEKEAEIAALKRRVEALERDATAHTAAADASTGANANASTAADSSSGGSTSRQTATTDSSKP